MRLLFDQNLSPRLREALRDLFPDSLHVRDIGFESADDESVWEYAGDRALVVVSKDSDFRQLSFTRGHPPKVVWIRRGNCTTSELESILRERYHDLIAFYEDEQSTFLALS